MRLFSFFRATSTPLRKFAHVLSRKASDMLVLLATCGTLVLSAGCFDGLAMVHPMHVSKLDARVGLLLRSVQLLHHVSDLFDSQGQFHEIVVEHGLIWSLKLMVYWWIL